MTPYDDDPLFFATDPPDDADAAELEEDEEDLEDEEEEAAEDAETAGEKLPGMPYENRSLQLKADNWARTLERLQEELARSECYRNGNLWKHR